VINETMMKNASQEVKTFVNLVMIACSEDIGVYPSEMVRRHKHPPLAKARGVFREVLKRHLKRVHYHKRVGIGSDRLCRLEVVDDSGNLAAGDACVAFCLNQDHSAQVHRGNMADVETVDRVDDAVMAAWPAVRKMGLFSGLMWGKGHANETVERFEVTQ